jgi:hypothetical protein
MVMSRVVTYGPYIYKYIKSSIYYMYPYLAPSEGPREKALAAEVPVEVDGLRLDWSQVPDYEVPAKRVELPSVRRRRAGRFIPPIPLGWYQRACQLPGKAPVLASALWYLHRLKRSKSFVVAHSQLNGFGLTRQAKYRALESLEAAGLISVERRPKKSPVVTILDLPDPPE